MLLSELSVLLCSVLHWTLTGPATWMTPFSFLPPALHSGKSGTRELSVPVTPHLPSPPSFPASNLGLDRRSCSTPSASSVPHMLPSQFSAAATCLPTTFSSQPPLTCTLSARFVPFLTCNLSFPAAIPSPHYVCSF